MHHHCEFIFIAFAINRSTVKLHIIIMIIWHIVYNVRCISSGFGFAVMHNDDSADTRVLFSHPDGLFRPVCESLCFSCPVQHPPYDDVISFSHMMSIPPDWVSMREGPWLVTTDVHVAHLVHVSVTVEGIIFQAFVSNVL